MIYCPNCNTANRDGSRFCNECGTSLAQANVRCQMCGDLNPQGRTNCANCGARLVIQAEAEPEEPAEEEAPAMPTAPMPASDAAQAATEATPSESAAAPLPEAEMPAWLRELRTTSFSEQPPKEPTPAPTPEQELPAWLRNIRMEQRDAASRSSGEPRTPKSPFRVPLMPSRFTPAPPEPPKASSEAPPTPQPTEPPATGEMPDWLKHYRETSAPAESSEAMPVEPTARAATDAPDWLAVLGQVTATPMLEMEAAPSAPEPLAELQPGNVPDWLKELAPAQAMEPSADLTLQDVAIEELPDWLRPTTTTPPALAAPSVESLAPGEVPSWLQALKPGVGLDTFGGDVIETSGLLAGIRGALPIESVLTLPHKLETSESPAAAVPVTGFAELFAPQPPPPPAAVSRPVRAANFMSLRVMLIILIFVVAALPFLPIWSDLRGSSVTRHQSSVDFYQTVEALRPNQFVLVAFDYTGGARGELDPQARAALLHLFQNKQHIITVSFVSDGAQLAQDLLNGLNPANTAFAYPYNYGDTHINLGYQSNGDAALRSLVQNPMAIFRGDYRGQPLTSWPMTKDLKSLNDFALLMVFSDDATQVRRWVEQVAQPSSKPLVAGVSAAAVPAVLPYYNSKQINGLLEGVRGAAEYEVSLSHPASASANLEAISYVAIVLVVVVLIGILLVLFSRRRRPSAA